jgi:hypothetical protein
LKRQLGILILVCSSFISCLNEVDLKYDFGYRYVAYCELVDGLQPKLYLQEVGDSAWPVLLADAEVSIARGATVYKGTFSDIGYEFDGLIPQMDSSYTLKIEIDGNTFTSHTKLPKINKNARLEVEEINALEHKVWLKDAYAGEEGIVFFDKPDKWRTEWIIGFRSIEKELDNKDIELTEAVCLNPKTYFFNENRPQVVDLKFIYFEDFATLNDIEQNILRGQASEGVFYIPVSQFSNFDNDLIRGHFFGTVLYTDSFFLQDKSKVLLELNPLNKDGLRIPQLDVDYVTLYGTPSGSGGQQVFNSLKPEDLRITLNDVLGGMYRCNSYKTTFEPQETTLQMRFVYDNKVYNSLPTKCTIRQDTFQKIDFVFEDF